MSDAYANLDATAQAALVRAGEVTPLELVDAAIARVEATNDALGAVVTPLFDRARERAQDPKLPQGPFRGVPCLFKDLGCHRAGDPLSMGTRLLRDAGFRTPTDSFLCQRFEAAGLIPIGRSNTPEFGLIPTTESVTLGPASNPWNPAYSTGGSSGGSAAAVAARVVPIAHGNDGGGSIRIPASACGLVGLKSSRGRVSFGPDFGDQWHGLVCEGVVTRSVRDTAAALDAIEGPGVGDPYFAPRPATPFLGELGRDPGKLRIGVLRRRTIGDAPLHDDCQRALDVAIDALVELGHDVADAAPEALFEPAAPIFFEVLASTHAARIVEVVALLTGATAGPEHFEGYTWHLVERGREVGGAAYIGAYEWLQSWSRRVAGWWEGFDLLLSPTLATPPPELGQLADTGGSPAELLARVFEFAPFAAPFNVTGQPAISLPLFWNDADLPVGIQLGASYGREDLLLRVAAQLEKARPWSQQTPRVCAAL
jgi:amidase